MLKQIAFLLCCIFIVSSAYSKSVFDATEITQPKQQNNTPFPDEEYSDLRSGEVIVLNKITASSKSLSILVGSTANYGKAELELHRCIKSQSSPHTSLMLVTMKDSTIKDDVKIIFHGWIFANSPSLSAAEHPIYQLIAVSCK